MRGRFLAAAALGAALVVGYAKIRHLRKDVDDLCETVHLMAIRLYKLEHRAGLL